MKKLVRRFNKKAMVLTGAMIFTMAMGTFAYAGTAENEKADQVEAMACIQAMSIVDQGFEESNMTESVEAVLMTQEAFELNLEEIHGDDK